MNTRKLHRLLVWMIIFITAHPLLWFVYDLLEYVVKGTALSISRPMALFIAVELF